jgi:hypothetical protein
MFRILIAALAALILVVTPGVHSSTASHASTTQWEQTAATLPGLLPGDDTGHSVALSAEGDIVALGEPQSQVTKPGRVRVFTLTSGTWTQMGGDLVGAANDDFFGTSVALSSDGLTLAVGAPGFEITGTSGAGRITIYRYDGATWNQRGSHIVGTASTKGLGSAVALSSDGTRVAAGASSGGTSLEGAVLVYDYTTDWAQKGSTILGGVASARSGTSVALSSDGSRLAIGGFGNNSSAGQARVFALAAGTWVLMGTAVEGVAASDNFGRSVDLNGAGDILAVGAPEHDTGGANSGQVSVFGWDGSAWSLRGGVINGAVAGDEFGYSVGINSEGTRVIAGAPLADSPGASAGEARVFSYASGVWEALGGTITGEATGDEAGRSVAMSAAGATVAIGAPKKSTDTGQVRVFGYPVAATTAGASSGLPGIALHVAGPIGRPVEGSPVYLASHKVASASPYVVRLTRVSPPQSSVILAEGTTDARGSFATRVTLGALAPGTYTLTLTGRHAFGTGLWLTTTFTVGTEGTYTAISDNAHGIW